MPSIPPWTRYPRLRLRVARLVLGWFLVALGVAAAAPLVHPQAVQLVCSANGLIELRAVAAGDLADAVDTAHAHALDCALCLLIHAPPPVATEFGGTAVADAVLVLRRFAAPVLALQGAPLPARGPPVIS